MWTLWTGVSLMATCELSAFTLSITAYDVWALNSNSIQAHSCSVFIQLFREGTTRVNRNCLVPYEHEQFWFCFILTIHWHISMEVLPQVYVLSPQLKNCEVHTSTGKLNSIMPLPNNIFSSIWEKRWEVGLFWSWARPWLQNNEC